MENSLFQAIEINDIDEVRVLLSSGANPNAQTENGYTPLMQASWRGYFDVVELLLNHGADPNLLTNFGSNPLSLSIQHDHIDITEILLKHGGGPLVRPATPASDPNIQDAYQYTPLMYASWYERPNTTKILLRYGADPNIQGDKGFTSLYLAVDKNNLEIIRILLNNNANPNIQIQNGSTALTQASWTGYFDAVKLLLEHHADPNIQTQDGATALILACQHEHLYIVELLLKYRADPNLQLFDKSDDKPYTALGLAIQNKNLQLVKLLIDHGALVTDRDLEHARRSDDPEIMGLVDFHKFILPLLNVNPKNTFGKDYSQIRPQYRKQFLKFVGQWDQYCSNPDVQLHPVYIKFIAKLIGIELTRRTTEEEICSLIRNKLEEHIDKISEINYSKFKDTDPISQEDFSEFEPFRLYQYGEPIEGKYRGITEDYINESLSKTEIIDPIDRSDLMNKKSNISNGNVYQDYLLRKMTSKHMIRGSSVLMKPEGPDSDIEDQQGAAIETLADKLNRFDTSQLIDFINQLNPIRRQPLPTNLSKVFYITMLIRDRDRFSEIPELDQLTVM